MAYKWLLGFHHFRCTFFCPPSMLRVFVNFSTTLPEIKSKEQALNLQQPHRRGLMLKFYFIFPSGARAVGIPHSSTLPWARHKLQGTSKYCILLIYCPPNSLQTTVRTLKPASQALKKKKDCSIAIPPVVLPYLLLKYWAGKISLNICRYCFGWNTWKNWLQEWGKRNPPHVYFWLL